MGAAVSFVWCWPHKVSKGWDFSPDILHKLCTATLEADCLLEIISSVILFGAAKLSLSILPNVFVICRQQICNLLFANNNFENIIPKHMQVSIIPLHNSISEWSLVRNYLFVLLYSKNLIVSFVNISIPAFTDKHDFPVFDLNCLQKPEKGNRIKK